MVIIVTGCALFVTSQYHVIHPSKSRFWRSLLTQFVLAILRTLLISYVQTRISHPPYPPTGGPRCHRGPKFSPVATDFLSLALQNKLRVKYRSKMKVE